MPQFSIALVNPNTKAATTAMMVEIAGEAAAGLTIGQNLSVQGYTVATGPEMIMSMEELSQAGTAVDTVVCSLRGGVPDVPDALIVSAYGDPGLESAERYFPGRAFGIGTASMREAGDGGRRFAVATTTPGLVPAIDGLVQRTGLASCYAGVFLTRTGPFELAADPDRQRDELADVVAAAIRIGGADAVIIGGGPLARSARQLASGFQASLIEPIPAAVKAAAAALASADQ